MHYCEGINEKKLIKDSLSENGYNCFFKQIYGKYKLTVHAREKRLIDLMG